MNPSRLHVMPSPLGDIALRAQDDCLTGVFFIGQKYFPDFDLKQPREPASGILLQAEKQISGFFAGQLHSFDIPLKLQGTPFQQKVWQGLLGIGYGEVIAYAELARRIGLGSEHARAVGSASGKNPASIIVPCHRVVGSNGALTGYAGGTDRKQSLLMLEKRPHNTVNRVESRH